MAEQIESRNQEEELTEGEEEEEGSLQTDGET